ncbi:MAG: precorrin-6y C5,15-methyltransferase (decarboxylating) subunit CbiE, partial [Zoogloea sp.]|uniref:precorrin-6y C5,15-methyltransferase (decarboxylating) subunit CbiE n=1 Tax=Zoogloea sp. TaxID=49181 RepID=UPI003F391707
MNSTELTSAPAPAAALSSASPSSAAIAPGENLAGPAAATLIGILDDGWAGLGDAARARLRGASLVIGARRTLELVAPQLHAHQRQKAMDGSLGRVPGWLADAHAAGEGAVVLATGDPLCFGLGRFLLNKGVSLRILPAVSTLQLAFARFCLPWQEARIASVHSQDAGEWAEGATPEHGLYPLVRLLAEHPLLGVFTSPENSPDRIARALLAAGFGDEVRLSVATRLALPDESLHPRLSLHEAAAQRFAEPNVVILERTAHPAAHPIFGLE